MNGTNGRQGRMGMKKMLMVAVALVATVTAANADLLGFKTPSGNIHCQLDDFGSSTYLRCDILKMESRVPPRPRDCDLDWGQSFSVTRHRAQRICHGDTVMDEDLPTLSHGSTWLLAGFTCLSEPSGLTCSNKVGHGFHLSRTLQRVF
jgi:hypothetical protein